MTDPTATLFVVVVLYGRGLQDSPTCMDLLRQIGPQGHHVVLIYDNSPSSHIKDLPSGWTMQLDPRNSKLEGAYNFALSRAKELGCRWLLLLDQDTNLPEDFISDTCARTTAMDSQHNVVAIVPIVRVGTRQVSPMIPRLGRESSLRSRNAIVSRWVVAINSGSCVRVEFIDAIGGFSKDFRLDFLDYWMFRMISVREKSIYVSNRELEHDLSVANMNSGITVSRYQGVLEAERQFTNGYLPPIWRLVLGPRLLGRGVKHLVVTRDKRLGWLMVRAAVAQLFSVFRSGQKPPAIA